MNNREPATTSPLLRRLNAAAILDALRSTGPATGTELMTATGLSRPTVHTVCDHLISEGWIHELEHRPPERGAGPGRRARQYEFNARAGFVIGIDLGQNKVTAVLADLRGNQVAENTRNFGREDIGAKARIAELRRAVDAALELAELPRSSVLAITLAVPGPVGDDGHVVAKEEYLPGLAKLDLRTAVGEGFDAPVLVENDANLAVLAERWRGAAQGVDNVIELLAGERLGSGLFLGGRLIRGGHGGAGELEFLNLVEGVGNTDGIARLAKAYGAKAVATRRRKTGALASAAGSDPGKIRAELVFAAAEAGDPAAVAVVDQVTTRIARVITLLNTLLDPDLVVIGGAVAQAGDVLIESLRRDVAALTGTPPRIVASTLGDHAVVAGAVRRALDHAELALFPEARPGS
ncbi:ROK family transcriptional regulator [Kribbella sp. HUAS MG21]|uniref:ROK family transcriptional regulator n=1 Tax=Kribbella sp. HUAS MG21 TaxID=3160966 RepID=A0AAU7T662_9ACTN